MAIYHLHCKIGTRSKGQSAVAAAAYQSAEKLKCERDGLVKDYSHKEEVVCTEIFLPANAPAEFKNREKLWNSVDNFNSASKSEQLFRKFDVALPCELSLNEQKKLMQKFCKQLSDRGMCVDLAIHNKDGNPHAHVQTTMRKWDSAKGNWAAKFKNDFVLDANMQKIPILDKSGNQKKDKSGRKQWQRAKVALTNWNSKDFLKEQRRVWQDFANEALQKSGFSEQIDCRTLQAQGINREPSKHLGVSVQNMEKRGIQTEIGDQQFAVNYRNAERKNTKRELSDYEKMLRRARQKYTAQQRKMAAQKLGMQVARTSEEVRAVAAAWRARNSAKNEEKIMNKTLCNVYARWENLPRDMRTAAGKIANSTANAKNYSWIAGTDGSLQAIEKLAAPTDFELNLRMISDLQKKQKPMPRRAVSAKFHPAKNFEKLISDVPAIGKLTAHESFDAAKAIFENSAKSQLDLETERDMRAE